MPLLPLLFVDIADIAAAVADAAMPPLLFSMLLIFAAD